jgi:uncharacterized protein (DUF433 family)
VIIEQLANSESWADIVRGYPELTEDDIRAVLYYASTAVEHTEFVEAA